MGNTKDLKGVKHITDLFVTILTLEKILQHFFTALFFIINVPGIGKPDAGHFNFLGNGVLAVLNIGMICGFVIGLRLKIKGIEMGCVVIGFFAALDIIFEFIFHGIFYITVSVLVSTILLIIMRNSLLNSAIIHSYVNLIIN